MIKRAMTNGEIMIMKISEYKADLGAPTASKNIACIFT